MDQPLPWMNEDSFLVRVPAELDALDACQTVARLFDALTLEPRAYPEVREVIPAARSLLVVLQRDMRPSEPLARLCTDIARGDSSLVLRDPTRTPSQSGPRGDRGARTETPSQASPVLEIPVRYGGSDGPDLEQLARLHQCSEESFKARHAETLYTVGFLGFGPGFAYLVGLPPELATPRRASPRARVPPGSVAIGGSYTGVYPLATPGGWHLIGRTEMPLWSLSSTPPSRFRPGQRVRFVPV